MVKNRNFSCKKDSYIGMSRQLLDCKVFAKFKNSIGFVKYHKIKN